MPDPLLSVRDLRVDYITNHGIVRAVDGVSFDLAEGEVLGLAGESGSGKSTAAQAVLRMLGPPAVISGGEVLFDGRDVLAMDDAELRKFRWREASLVFQSAMNALNPVITIGEQLTDVYIAQRVATPSKAEARARKLLELVEIDPDRMDSFAHELSGGMRQRVIIAMALALEPRLLIMDEPTTALDVVVERDILGKIKQLQQQLGFAVLFISHDLSLMLSLCDRVGVIYAGKLAELAPAQSLRRGGQHPYTRGLTASFPSLRGPRRVLQGIGGTPPDMRAPPSGCRFHPRCPDAVDQCGQSVPSVTPLGHAHLAACHLLESQPTETGA